MQGVSKEEFVRLLYGGGVMNQAAENVVPG
jgi:hypothetical protein